MNMVLVNYVSYYATQVRGFLKGLSPEVVEELTGGLEADLIEAMSENTEVSDTSDITLNDLIARFGTPEAYARELCESAGVDFDGAKAAGQMPVSGALRSKSRNPFKRFGAWIASLVAAVIGLGARAQGIKFSPAVVKFLTEMRPAWWFVRGWLVYCIIVQMEGQGIQRFPQDLAHWWLFAGIVLLSALLGLASARHAVPGFWSKAVIALNVFVLLFVPAFTRPYQDRSPNDAYDSGYSRGYDDGQEAMNASVDMTTYGPSNGYGEAYLSQMDLGSASNLFVYDAEGNLIPDARIIDDKGNSLDAAFYPIKVNRVTRTVDVMNARADEYGRPVLNVFPASFSAVDIVEDTCSEESQRFWNAVMSGHINEQWDDDWDEDEDDGSLRHGRGLLRHNTFQIEFRYGPHEKVLYLGGISNLPSDSECIYGFKRPGAQEPEAPAFKKLPALAPLSIDDESASSSDESPSSVDGDAAEGGSEEGAKGSDGKSEDDKKESGSEVESTEESAEEAVTGPADSDSASSD
ncbi:hypothetical protein ACFSYH_11945 [Populibacterium corticicola]|uniref:DUF805 domain-containing protein n=1 Tax=Populibacterium corticicola TaxID=1812826 RepID=A0ABW5XH14_9MICO